MDLVVGENVVRDKDKALLRAKSRLVRDAVEESIDTDRAIVSALERLPTPFLEAYLDSLRANDPHTIISYAERGEKETALALLCLDFLIDEETESFVVKALVDGVLAGRSVLPTTTLKDAREAEAECRDVLETCLLSFGCSSESPSPP